MIRSTILIFLLTVSTAPAQQKVALEKEAAMKADLGGQIEGMKKQAQVMVDSVFSFGELGFQEFETSKYLSGILEKEGFKVERGIAGIPTAFVATWGEGKPVISLGSDIDDIPQASQKPGVAYHDPMIEGAPGHGEGHNSGVPLNILAALAVKKVMQRETCTGRSKSGPASRKRTSGPRPITSKPACSKTSISYCSRTSPTTLAWRTARLQTAGWFRSNTRFRARALTPPQLPGAGGARSTRSS
jgi:hypothetical protein